MFCLLVFTFAVCYLFNSFFSAVLFSPQTYFYSQARTSLPPYPPPPHDSMNEAIIRKLNPVGSRRFQIHLCLLSWVMSREFTRGSFDELMKVFEGILSIQRFSIWPNTEIFSYNKIFIAHYACKKCRFEFGTTKGFIFQIINSLIESWGGAGGGYAWPTLTVFVNCKLFLLNFFFCLHRPSLNSLVSCGQYFCFIMWFFIKFFLLLF